LTHEINHTVAAFAAATGKSGVEFQSQYASRPRLPHARSMCFTSIRPVYDARKRGGVLAVRHVTRPKSRRMVWLEVCQDGRARIMVDKAQYNDWKEKHSMKDVAGEVSMGCKDLYKANSDTLVRETHITSHVYYGRTISSDWPSTSSAPEASLFFQSP
jgi:hypothetical protein